LVKSAAPLAYTIRFYQWQNFRQLFWETELRTVSQGHPDYRVIEQEKYRRVKEKFPLIASFMLVDTNEYAIARRGTEEQIVAKEKRLIERLREKKKPSPSGRGRRDSQAGAPGEGRRSGQILRPSLRGLAAPPSRRRVTPHLTILPARLPVRFGCVRRRPLWPQ